MSAKRFLDTNILFYACDPTDAAKQLTAQQLISAASTQGDGVVSVQVLGEFFYSTVRKKRLTATEAETYVKNYAAALDVVPVEWPLVEQAMQVHQKYQTSYWDSLIIAAAARHSCTEIVSEDMSDGQVYQGVQVRNPFLQPTGTP